MLPQLNRDFEMKWLCEEQTWVDTVDPGVLWFYERMPTWSVQCLFETNVSPSILEYCLRAPFVASILANIIVVVSHSSLRTGWSKLIA